MERLAWALVVLVPAVVLHEVAHGLVALTFGDPTARRAGRLTLNPVAHVDPFGTVILPLLLAFTTGSVFGYAKPVPVNRANLRRPRDQGLLVSLAGPATNVLLAVAAALVLRGGAESGLVAEFLFRFGVVNVILAAFNLLPIPPLDGSALVERVLPGRLRRPWARLQRWAMPLLLGVVLLFPGALGTVFGAARDLWLQLL